MNKTAVCLSVFFAFLMLNGCSRSQKFTAHVQERVSETTAYRSKLETQGVISADDHARLMSITDRLQRDHTVSDQDLDFWLGLLKQGPPREQHLNRLQFEAIVFGALGGRKILTLTQKNRLYAAVLPYVYDRKQDIKVFKDAEGNEKLATGTQILALRMLASTRDSRALPVLKGLSQTSRHEEVRADAKRYHDKLQAILKNGNA